MVGIRPEEENHKEDEEHPRCGFGRCSPRWMQLCNNPKAFLWWLCWMGFIQGFVVNGITNVNISTLERRYNLPSSQVGLIASAYDFSAGVLVLPITFLGAHAHQPRLIAIAAFVMSLGSFMMALPQFTTGIYEMGTSSAAACEVSGNITTCTEVGSGLSNYLYVFIGGQVLHGVGGTTLYSLGVVFIDSNVRNKDSPVYQALMNFASTLGPALGYVLGGQVLDIYVDFYRVTNDQIDTTVNDPRWVGAWWLCYVVSCVLAMTAAIGIAPYPRRLPQYYEVQEHRKSQAHQDKSASLESKSDFGKSVKDHPRILKFLLCHPTNMLLALIGIFEGIIIAGFATFMPKFIQNQFYQTSSRAAILGGLMAVPGAAGGQILGGVLVRVFNLKVKGMLRLIIGLALAFPLCLIPFIFARCDPIPLAGVSVKYTNGSSSDLSTTCNAKCGCSTSSYEPVCAVDNLQYFSSCHAGCQDQVLTKDGIKTYFNCSCVSLPSAHNSTTAAATQGQCEVPCNTMSLFLAALFFCILLTFMIQVPALNISLRCIPDNQRAFGIGVKWVFVRFLGTVPGPVIYGSIFDSTCELWQDKCGQKGSCWMYNNYDLAIRVFLVTLCLKVGTLMAAVAAYSTYRPPVRRKEEQVNMKANSYSKSDTESESTVTGPVAC